MSAMMNRTSPSSIIERPFFQNTGWHPADVRIPKSLTVFSELFEEILPQGLTKCSVCATVYKDSAETEGRKSPETGQKV